MHSLASKLSNSTSTTRHTLQGQQNHRSGQFRDGQDIIRLFCEPSCSSRHLTNFEVLTGCPGMCVACIGRSVSLTTMGLGPLGGGVGATAEDADEVAEDEGGGAAGWLLAADD